MDKNIISSFAALLFLIIILLLFPPTTADESPVACVDYLYISENASEEDARQVILLRSLPCSQQNSIKILLVGENRSLSTPTSNLTTTSPTNNTPYWMFHDGTTHVGPLTKEKLRERLCP